VGYNVLICGKLKVAALSTIDERYVETAPALAFLRDKASQAQYSASAMGFKALLERFARGDRLPAESFHEANKEKRVWEFVKGDLRLFCFRDRCGNVVLTHGIVKKGQKADKHEVERANQARIDFGDVCI
jgi:hypothetical protein